MEKRGKRGQEEVEEEDLGKERPSLWSVPKAEERKGREGAVAKVAVGVAEVVPPTRLFSITYVRSSITKDAGVVAREEAEAAVAVAGREEPGAEVAGIRPGKERDRSTEKRRTTVRMHRCPREHASLPP